MNRKHLLLCAVSLLWLAPSAYAQVNWPHQIASSPLLKGAIDQLEREGVRLDLNKATADRVGPFIVAIVPVPPDDKVFPKGTTALIVTLMPVPRLKEPVVVEVARVDYRRASVGNSVDLYTQTATVSAERGFGFDKELPFLRLTEKGDIQEMGRGLLLAEQRETIDKNCEDLVARAADQRCGRFTGFWPVSRMLCAVTGLFWAQTQCTATRREPLPNK